MLQNQKTNHTQSEEEFNYFAFSSVIANIDLYLFLDTDGLNAEPQMIRNMYDVDCVLLWCGVCMAGTPVPRLAAHHSILHEQTQNRDMISIVCLGIYDGWQWFACGGCVLDWIAWCLLPAARYSLLASQFGGYWCVHAEHNEYIHYIVFDAKEQLLHTQTLILCEMKLFQWRTMWVSFYDYTMAASMNGLSSMILVLDNELLISRWIYVENSYREKYRTE